MINYRRLAQILIPRSLRLSIKNLLFKELEKQEAPNIENALKAIQKMGFCPQYSIDVGAYIGEWTQTFSAIFPESKILMVEPQESKKAALQAMVSNSPKKLFFESTLLGASNDEIVEFYEMETGSSVFEENSPHSRTLVKKNLQKLDTLAQNKGFPKVDFLKVDVQGYELNVLRGATEILKDTTFVLVESSLVPINQGCPLIAEVIEFMNDLNFRLFDICSLMRREDGVLWQTDLMFIKSDSSFVPTPNTN